MPPLTHELIEARLPRFHTGDQSPAPLPERQMRRSMDGILAERPGRDGLWVFAYGSLIWAGKFARDAEAVGTVQGLVRHYSIWDDRIRGTPDRRTLTLGLDPAAGACAGIAYHLPEASLPDALWSIWTVEMAAGTYTAEWVDAALATGMVRAVTFVSDPYHPMHAGELPIGEIADIVAAGQGPGGTAAAYLLETAAALRDRGIPDPMLERLQVEVAARLLA